MRTKTTTVQVKAGEQDGLGPGEFLVYPSTFTRTPDSYGDVVAKGAFLDSLAAWKASGNILPGLFGHRMDDPDYYVASASEMGEDEHGWWVKGEFDLESPKGPQVYRLVKGRRLTQLSFAYDVLDEGAVQLEDGTKANELRKVHVHEFSFVPAGANPDTSVVAVKAADLVAAFKTSSPVLDEETQDDSKASGQAHDKDGDPAPGESEDQSVNPSVEAKSAEIINYDVQLDGEEILDNE